MGERVRSAEDLEDQVFFPVGRDIFSRIRGLIHKPESANIVCRVRMLEVPVLSECKEMRRASR